MSDQITNHWEYEEALVRERQALRAVVVDMLAGLAYLRSTNNIPYGFGIDRLEETGRAALGEAVASS